MPECVLAGLVAFNFWEPLAEAAEPALENSFLQGYEDAFCLVLLFGLVLGLLRLVTNSMAPAAVAYPSLLQRNGSVIGGLATGYLVAGFLTCVLQTLPWHESFMGYEARPKPPASWFARVMPPDRVWLATMRRAGAFPLAYEEDRREECRRTPTRNTSPSTSTAPLCCATLAIGATATVAARFPIWESVTRRSIGCRSRRETDGPQNHEAQNHDIPSFMILCFMILWASVLRIVHSCRKRRTSSATR